MVANNRPPGGWLYDMKVKRRKVFIFVEPYERLGLRTTVSDLTREKSVRMIERDQLLTKVDTDPNYFPSL